MTRIAHNYCIDKDKGRGYTIHAEVAACLKYPKKMLKGATLIVIRVYRGEIRDSTPCANCAKFIEKYGIAKVIHS